MTEVSIDISKVKLSPKDAAQLLEKHKDDVNRRTSAIRSAQMRADMEAGLWVFDGSPLKFDNQDNLLDGRHRISALAGANPDVGSIEFLVIRGLDPESQMVMDSGGTRTAGQNLGLKGFKEATLIAASVRLYLEWSHGRLFSTGTNHTSKAETIAWTLGHQELVEAVLGTDFRNAINITPSVLGAFALMGLQTAPEKTVEFLTKVAFGNDLQEGDPILALRRRMERLRGEGKIRVRPRQEDILAYVIKAWNLWIAGEKAERLGFRHGIGAANFPTYLRAVDVIEPTEETIGVLEDTLAS